MARIFLVRHGEPAALWSDELDSGLNEQGRSQALKTAQDLAPLGPLDIISSPLKRARETAEPLVELWDAGPRIEPRVTEIPTPLEFMDTRSQWLERTSKKQWSSLDGDLTLWRQGVIDAILELERDTVVFTHFVALNVVVGAATGNDGVMFFWPYFASVTIVETDGRSLTLVQRGGEAFTDVR